MGQIEVRGNLLLPSAEGTDARHAVQRDYVGQTITFSRSGTLATATGALRWYADRAWVIEEVRASVGTAPTGASVIVDVNKNGTTIFSTQGNRPTITIGTNTDGSNVPDVTALADGDYLTVDIDQIGSVTPGSNLTVQIVLGLV